MIATCILVPAGVAGFNPDLAHEYSLSKTWGGTGTADGQLGDPGGVAADGSDNIYVTEQGNNRISVFTSDGVFIRKWGELFEPRRHRD